MNETTSCGILRRALAESRASLSEIESKHLLELIGVPTAIPEAAVSADDAARIAERIGFPVVLKVISPEISHKSEVGGVLLNLRSAVEVRDGFESIRRSLATAAPDARFEGVAVQAMAPEGVELIVGVTRDQRFGPLVMVGLGGVFVEVLKDTALRLAPVDEDEASAMLAELKGAAMLSGTRGRAAIDSGAVAGLIAAVSRFAARNPELGEMDLNPVVAYPDGLRVLDARIALAHPVTSADNDPHHAGRLENLKRAFTAKTVAVIGDKRVGGYLWLRSMSEFTGKLYSVQIDPNEIAGIEAMGVENRKSLAEIPEHIDYAVSAVPRQVAPRILKDCIANNVGAVGFFTSGFSETGEELGARLEKELTDAAMQSDIALVGPNCMGLYSPAVGMRNFPDEKLGQPGDVCFISQSGTHAINFCMQAPARGIGINKAASIGNVIVLEAADYVDVMAADPGTRVLGMYVEGPGDGRRFFNALREAARRCPVLIWKGGVTDEGARASFSHTGSLATPRAVWSAMVRQSGAVEVENLDAMLDAMELIARGKPVTGRRMGLVAMTGGQSVVITDTFSRAGLEVPALSESSYEELKHFFNIVGGSYRNPLDAGGTIGGGLHLGNLERILSILDRDPVIDAIVLEIGTGLRASHWAAHEDEIIGLLDKVAEFARGTEKTFGVILHPAHVETIVARARQLARERGLVVFESFERAAAAFRTAVECAAARTRHG